MASSPFCHFLKLLLDIQPALSPNKVPTLHAFSDLAKEFTLQESDSTLVDLSRPAEAVSSPKKATLKSAGNGIAPPSKDQACLFFVVYLPHNMRAQFISGIEDMKGFSFMDCSFLDVESEAPQILSQKIFITAVKLLI